MNSILVEKKFTAGQSLQIVQGDITTEEVDRGCEVVCQVIRELAVNG